MTTRYRIYCFTEQAWTYGWANAAPTTCFNNAAHSINLNSVSIVDNALLTTTANPATTLVIDQSANTITGAESIATDAINVGGHALRMDDLADADTTTAAPTTRKTLAWNGTNWTPANPINIQANGSALTTSAPYNTLNFTGNGVSVSDATNGVATISVDGTPLEHESYEYDVASTTTLTASYKTYSTFTTNNKPAGTYRIGWFANYSLSKTATDGYFQITLDGVEIAYNRMSLSATSASPVYITGSGSTASWNLIGFKYVSWTGSPATHTLVLNFKSNSSTMTVGVRNVRYEIWRVDNDC